MKRGKVEFKKTSRIILGGFLAVLVYLQSECDLGHTEHIVTACILVFAAAVGINKKTEWDKQEFSPPEMAGIPKTDPKTIPPDQGDIGHG